MLAVRSFTNLASSYYRNKADLLNSCIPFHNCCQGGRNTSTAGNFQFHAPVLCPLFRQRRHLYCSTYTLRPRKGQSGSALFPTCEQERGPAGMRRYRRTVYSRGLYELCKGVRRCLWLPGCPHDCIRRTELDQSSGFIQGFPSRAEYPRHSTQGFAI